VEKINAELVTLTYGTLVAQLSKDYNGDYREINRQLDTMGYNIGIRLIEDYLAKSNATKRCSTFRETAEMISRVSSSTLCIMEVGACRCGYIWVLIYILVIFRWDLRCFLISLLMS
jgi:hypothetical protein